MMRPFRITIVAILLATTLLINACQGAPQSKPNTLTAIRVSQATLDAASELWAKAPVLEVPTQGVEGENPPPGPALRFQAIYDSKQIAVRVEWPDPTESIYKNAWTWDGSSFSRGGDEDRLMIHFPMANDPEFASKSCASLCHNNDDNPEKWAMGANDSQARYDQWHWKSTRTNPVGQADDKYLGVQTDPADTESGHYTDELDSGGEQWNENDRLNGPAFLNGANPDDPFIYIGQQIPIDTSQLEAGAVIAGYMLSPMTGSRGDISAQGVWEAGKWVVVLLRALDTGHDDDVVFIPPKPVPFGVAVTDNDGGYKHNVGVDVLTLEWTR